MMCSYAAAWLSTWSKLAIQLPRLPALKMLWLLPAATLRTWCSWISACPAWTDLDALRHLKDTLSLPVIFLTARRRELDEVVGLELGADDYITKPFDVDVLLAHIKAVLRRTERTLPSTAVTRPAPLVVGELTIDPSAHSVSLAGKNVSLTPREFDLLYTLAVDAGRVLSMDELLGRVWGAEFIGQPQVVYVHIRWLREKLEKTPSKPQPHPYCAGCRLQIAGRRRLMFRTLRNRLLLSHILPLMLIIPLMGVGLVYVLETQVLLPRLAQNIVGDARLLTEISRTEYDLWGNPLLFGRMLSRTQLDPALRVMFLTPEGALLYSTDPADNRALVMF